MEVSTKRLPLTEPLISLLLPLIIVFGSLFLITLGLDDREDFIYRVFYLLLSVGNIFIGIFFFTFAYRFIVSRIFEIEIVVEKDGFYIPKLYLLHLRSFSRELVFVTFENISHCEEKRVSYSETWFVPWIYIQLSYFPNKCNLSSNYFKKREDFILFCNVVKNRSGSMISPEEKN